MVEPGRSAAVASQLTGRDLHGERSLGARPGGLGVLVADEVEVTWLQPPVPAPHPGAELLAYLAAHGFADMPRYFGAVEHDDTVIARALACSAVTWTSATPLRSVMRMSMLPSASGDRRMLGISEVEQPLVDQADAS